MSVTRSRLWLAGTLACAAVVAAAGCSQLLGLQDPTTGGGGDDGGSPDAPAADAPPGTPDAPAGMPDAFVPDAPIAADFGKVCTMAADCSAPADTCVPLNGGTGHMFCTLSCGTTSDTNPPPNGDALCQQSYSPTLPGQAACGAYAPMGAQNIWFCVILCPAGNCPTGLTCDTAMGGVCD
jgi:hypothetical protein